MIFTKGYKYKPTFISEVQYFEFDHLDEKTNMIHSIVHCTNGFTFIDTISKTYYENAFEMGIYENY